MSFIKDLLSRADKADAGGEVAPPVAVYAPLVGVDPHALLKSAELARDNATRRRLLLLDERDRLENELAKTDLSIKATNACIEALAPLIVGNLDRELADMVLGTYDLAHPGWSSDMREENERDPA